MREPSPNSSELAAVGRIALFAGVAPESLAALTGRTIPRRFHPGELVFREGDACVGAYALTAGAMRIFKNSASGRELTLHVDEAPAMVAEVPLMDGGGYPASAVAVGPVEALFIPRQHFIAVCAQHPQVALAVLTVFGRRLRGLVALVEAITFGGVRQRLAQILLDRTRAGVSLGSSGERPVLAITHQELARELGTVREVVSRNLSRFQSEGLILVKHREITLLNPGGLAREAASEIGI